MTSTTEPNLRDVIDAARPRRRSRKRYFVIGTVIIIAAVAAVLLFHKRKEDDQKLPHYETQAVTRGDVALTITATGNLEPTNEVTVGSEISGKLTEVDVDINDQVKKDQKLAVIDTSVLEQQIASSRASVNSAKAQVVQAQATLNQAQAALKRADDLRQLSGGKIPSQADYDTAVAQSERAKADLLVAQASVGTAQARMTVDETNMAKAIIKSPIDGIVLTRNVDPGQTVAASFQAPELFIIAENLAHMKLVVTVAEADIAHLKAGQEATFTVDAWPDRTYHATVTRVSFGSTITNNVVSYETELSVDNSDLTLRPGMTATAQIKVAESKDAMIVPAAALRFSPASEGPPSMAAPGERRTFVQSIAPFPRRRRPSGGALPGGEPNMTRGHQSVYVLRDGEPVKVPVRVGITQGANIEVKSPELKEGDEVILRAL